MNPKRACAVVTAAIAFAVAAPATALASGNVDVTDSGGVLRVTGDGGDNTTLFITDDLDSQSANWDGYSVRIEKAAGTLSSSDGTCSPATATNSFYKYYCAPVVSSFVVDLGDGNDEIDGITLGAPPAHAPGVPNGTVNGGAGNDDIGDGNGNDSVDGGPGDDLIDAHAGNDFQDGDGNDSMQGGAGNDKIHGGNGNDTLTDTDGTDELIGDFDDDDINVGDGTGGDIANCGGGVNDVATADTDDSVVNACETVHRPSSGGPPPDGNPPPSGGSTVAAHISAALSQLIGKQHGLILKGSCPNGCTLAARATVSVPRLAKVYRFKSAPVQVGADETKTLKVKMKGKGYRAIVKALRKHKKLKAKVTILATDSAGNSTPYKSTIKLRR